jgi:hypothetical protein
MRVCDKCETNQIYTTFVDKRDNSEFDICTDCYTRLSDWLYNADRKKENDPVVDPPVIIDKPKKEVRKRGKRTKR